MHINEKGGRAPLESYLPAIYWRELKLNHNLAQVIVGDETNIISLTERTFAGTGMYCTSFASEGKLYKVFFPKDDELKYKEVISEEAILQKKVLHPNVAKLDGLGIIKIGDLEVTCLIREDVPFSLNEIIEKKPLSVEEGLKLIKEISSACQYVYNETGEIITDLTVENIRQREDGSWAICDLGGTAKKGKGSSKPVSIDAIFTAPEITEDDPNNTASVRSISYSLALILWTSLTGKSIDRFDLALSSIEEICTQDSIPDNIYSLIQKGISIDPNIRPQSPLSFYKELHQCVSSTKTDSTS